jgi:hypothetical protein
VIVVLVTVTSLWSASRRRGYAGHFYIDNLTATSTA